MDAWWTVLVVDPLALRLLPVLDRRSFVTPTRITLFAAVLAALSVGAFADGLLVAGALLFEVSFFFDCLDGKLARIRGNTSELGAFLDLFLDVVLRAAAFVALALRVWPDSRLLPALLASLVFAESWLRIYPSARGARPAPAGTPGALVRAKDAMARHRLVLLPSTVELETLCLFVAPLTQRGDVIRVALAIAVGGYAMFAALHLRRFRWR